MSIRYSRTIGTILQICAKNINASKLQLDFVGVFRSSTIQVSLCSYCSARNQYSKHIAGSSKTPICSPTGLVCLAGTDWYNTSDTHDCLPLCEFSHYLLLPTLHYVCSFLVPLLEIFATHFFFSIQKTNENTRLLHLSIVFPKSRMVRDVVFTYGQMFGNLKSNFHLLYLI